MAYGVTIQTLGRPGRDCITVVFVGASDPATARDQARRIAEQRYGCAVLTGTVCPVPDRGASRSD